MNSDNIIAIEEWSPVGLPFHIFGPCSAESREQVLDTARELKTLGVNFIFRAGVWKPRTRPGTFAGIGTPALEWLREVKEELGLPVTTEVARAEHVEAALKAGIDVLWIGARTAVNPFSVQEIADVLQGVDIPVLVKNPIHPDLSLWIGALERIQDAGVNRIAAIHRGFHYHENYPYRNLPNWELAIELKRRFPKLPIICDASHIAGRPDIIPRVAQRSLDLQMDGLLIEAHIDPPNALSDSQQQVTPQHLKEILDSLETRQAHFEDDLLSDELLKLRSKIDSIDDTLIELLSERMKVVEKIGEHKRENNVAIFQLERWMEINDRCVKWGKELGLEESLVKKILVSIHEQSIEIQQRIMDHIQLTSKE